MYQALLPSGYNPQYVLERHLEYLNALGTHTDTVNANFEFPIVVNKPEAVTPGTLFLSIHSSLYFANLPFALRRVVENDIRINVLIRRDSRSKLPLWKELGYREMEADFNIRFLYTDDPHSLLTFVKALRKGEYALSYIDSKPKGKEVATKLTNFMNSQLAIPRGFFDLSEKYGFPIAPVAALSQGTPVLSFAQPFQLQKDGWLKNWAKDQQEKLDNCLHFFQNALMANPAEWSQWGFFYDQYENENAVNFSGLIGSEIITFRENDSDFIFDFGLGRIEKLI